MALWSLAGCGAEPVQDPDGTSGGTDATGAFECSSVRSVYVTLDTAAGVVVDVVSGGATPSPHGLDAPSVDPSAITLRDDAGAVVGTVSVPLARLITTEQPDALGEYAAVEGDLVTFVAPWPKDAASLEFAGHTLTVDPCAQSTAKALGDATAVWSAGPPDERANLVILGDGYGADDEGAFDANVARIVRELSTKEPYANYIDFLNVYAIWTPSVETGIPAAAPGNTALSCFRDTEHKELKGGIFKCDRDAIFNTLRRGFKFKHDMLLILANDDRGRGVNYGGVYAVAGIDERFADVSLHELGHQTGLADEYKYANRTMAPSGHSAPNCSTSANTTPWEPWRGEFGVGAFMECGYHNLHRPTDTSCRMKFSNRDHCPVCRDHIVRWLYERAGKTVQRGTPVDGSVTLQDGATETFEPELVKPQQDSLAYGWLAGGRTASNLASYDMESCKPGAVTVDVDDTTTWVRIGRPNVLKRQVSWWVECPDAPIDRIYHDADSVRQGRFDYHRVDVQPDTPVIVRVTGPSDVDLYVAMDRNPTLEDSDKRAFGHEDDVLEYQPPTSGTLHVGVYGYEASSYEVEVYRKPEEQ